MDYRLLPTSLGGGQDVTYFINAACQSASRLYIGGVFNLVGQKSAFNIAYFENGRWSSPPVTIGSDPATLLYNRDLSSRSSQGKVLALACPPPLYDGSSVIIIGGEFVHGGLRLGGAGGIPFLGPDGPRDLHHLALLRVVADPEDESETANLCPVIQSPASTNFAEAGPRTRSQSADEAKMQCSPGVPRTDIPPGVHIEQAATKLTGPPNQSASAHVSAITCLNTECTDLVIAGYFNMVLGQSAFSAVRLIFDEYFHAATSVPLHPASSSLSTAENLASPPSSPDAPPDYSLGGFIKPVPGVNGAVHACAVINDDLGILGGSFQKAGAGDALNIAIWDRRKNLLRGLNVEWEINSTAAASVYGLEGLAGQIRVALPMSYNRVLLGGSFSDVTSRSGHVSLNLLLMEIMPGDQSASLRWRRLPTVDNISGYDVGPNGPVTSAVCVESRAETGCTRALVGGWFDTLQACVRVANSTQIETRNATPDGLLDLPVVMLTLPESDDQAPASLSRLPLNAPSLSLLTSGATVTRASAGVNSLVEMRLAAAEEQTIVVAGKLSAVGNIGLLSMSGSDEEAAFHLQPLIDPWATSAPELTKQHFEDQRAYCWQDEDMERSLVYEHQAPAAQGASATFCCFIGALCPFEGVAVNCPPQGGFYCLPHMNQPKCCAEGFYCPNPGVVRPCEKEHYCSIGSTAQTPCTWWMWCRKPNLQRPDKIMAGVASLVLVFGIAVACLLANWTFLRLRSYLRNSRESRRDDRPSSLRRGSPLSGKGPQPDPPRSSKRDSSPLKSIRRQVESLVHAQELDSVVEASTFRQQAEHTGGNPLRSEVADDTRSAKQVERSRRQNTIHNTRQDLLATIRDRQKVERIDLEFRNLTVELAGVRKKILDNVTGGFRSGRVTAVMGPSGCGKTTLISALSNRLGFGSRMSGTTFINGAPESSTALHDLMGFVPQDDIMFEDLTVKENLGFCCALRADPHLSRKDRDDLVDKVIGSLGLTHSRHTIIGSTEERGISGGQRKRVNVGMELTSKPLVLFLDEPTSGLDSTTAEDLMRYLHRLTDTGLTIAAVIHQPRIEVFLGIDDVIFLGRGGRVAYYGAAKDTVQYFSSLGYSFHPRVNPADRVLDIITKSDDLLYDQWQATAEQSAGEYAASEFGYWTPKSISQDSPAETNGSGAATRRQTEESRGKGQAQADLDALAGRRIATSMDGLDHKRTLSFIGRRPSIGLEGRRASAVTMTINEEQVLPSRRYPALPFQAWICFCRSLVQQHNNLAVIQHDLQLLMLFGLLVGLFDLGIKQYELSVLCMGLTATLAGVRYFSVDRVVFWRECSSGISILAYFIGKVTAALPIIVLYPLAYLSFYYNMGFPNVSFGFYYLLLLWAGFVCFGVGIIMSLLFEPKNAQIGGVVIALIGFLFGGHNPNVITLQKSAPGRIGMVLSYVRWSIGALLLEDASLNPLCQAQQMVAALAAEGFVSQDVIKNSMPQSFEPRVVDTEVSHCRQMLINNCVFYLVLAMLLLWLSGKYRARMIGWDYVKTGAKQWRARVRERWYTFLQRNYRWLPTWLVDLMVGMKYETLEEEEDNEFGEDRRGKEADAPLKLEEETIDWAGEASQRPLQPPLPPM